VSHGFDNPPGHGFTIGALLPLPKSRGRISLRSSSPEEFPLISPNYLSHDADLAVLIEGVKRCRKLAASAAFEEYREAEYLPRIQVQSDEEINAYISSYVQWVYHRV